MMDFEPRIIKLPDTRRVNDYFGITPEELLASTPFFSRNTFNINRMEEFGARYIADDGICQFKGSFTADDINYDFTFNNMDDEFIERSSSPDMHVIAFIEHISRLDEWGYQHSLNFRVAFSPKMYKSIPDRDRFSYPIDLARRFDGITDFLYTKERVEYPVDFEGDKLGEFPEIYSELDLNGKTLLVNEMFQFLREFLDIKRLSLFSAN